MKLPNTFMEGIVNILNKVQNLKYGLCKKHLVLTAVRYVVHKCLFYGKTTENS